VKLARRRLASLIYRADGSQLYCSRCFFRTKKQMRRTAGICAHTHETAIQFFMVWTNKLNAFFATSPDENLVRERARLSPRPRNQLQGLFGRQKRSRMCVSSGEISRERRRAASARFPGRRFHQVSRHEIRNRAAPETMGRNDNVAYVVIPASERTRERAPAKPSVCNRRVSCVRQKACHFPVCVALWLFLARSYSDDLRAAHTSHGRPVAQQPRRVDQS
jgi:hypothetical protein